MSSIGDLGTAVKDLVKNLKATNEHGTDPGECRLCNGSGWIKLGKGNIYSPCPDFMEANVKRYLNAFAPKPIADALNGRKLMPGYSYALPEADSSLTVPRRIEISPSRYVADHGFPMAAQEVVLKKLGSNPLAGYFFYGPTGTGKTFLLWALLQEAIYANRKVIYCTAGHLARLISSQRDEDAAEIEEIKSPELWMGSPVHIYIDELDSIPTRENTLRGLFEIISASYDTRLSIISAASNAAPNDLAKIIGSASMRRLRDITTIIKTSK